MATVVEDCFLGQAENILPFSMVGQNNQRALYCCVTYIKNRYKSASVRRKVIFGPLGLKFYITWEKPASWFLPWICNEIWKVARSESYEGFQYLEVERAEVTVGGIPGLDSPFVKCVGKINTPLDTLPASLYEITSRNSKTLRFLMLLMKRGYWFENRHFAIPCYPTAYCAEHGNFLNTNDFKECRLVLTRALLNGTVTANVFVEHTLSGESSSTCDLTAFPKLESKLELFGKQPLYSTFQLLRNTITLQLNQAPTLKKKTPPTKKRKREEIEAESGPNTLFHMPTEIPTTRQQSIITFTVNNE